MHSHVTCSHLKEYFTEGFELSGNPLVQQVESPVKRRLGKVLKMGFLL